MNYSQRVQIKKPIFDDYYPQSNNYMSQLSKSVSPINNTQTNFQSRSLQYSSYNSLTQSRQKERIFQQKKIPISIQKNSLFDLKSSKMSNSNMYSTIGVSEFDKPLHFQTDQLIQRPVTIESQPKLQEQNNIQNFAPILEEKNDRFIKIGVVIIIVLLLLIGILKFK
ncbi:unnamed protein product [Paramecium primaurelia]|uniref:Transmembrane protein n=1 Tax=Paramecium primaurelia TaxID=5886 RepID=A0A8S1LAH7_PARPR|nr:unnamed protein product [Paramecium primaurelia]